MLHWTSPSTAASVPPPGHNMSKYVTICQNMSTYTVPIMIGNQFCKVAYQVLKTPQICGLDMIGHFLQGRSCLLVVKVRSARNYGGGAFVTIRMIILHVDENGQYSVHGSSPCLQCILGQPRNNQVVFSNQGLQKICFYFFFQRTI